MTPLNADKLETLANQVYAWLAEQILTGALRPGQWISENEIATQFGVSRSPVREALRALARDGSVEILPRRGTMIAEFTAADVDGHYRARELVEPELASLAVSNIDASGVSTLKSLADRLHNADGDLDVYYQFTLQFWTVLFDACPNRTIADVASSLWRRAGRFRGIALAVPSFQLVVIDFFDTLAENASEGDGASAKAAMTRLLVTKRETLLDSLFLHVSGDRAITRVDP